MIFTIFIILILFGIILLQDDYNTNIYYIMGFVLFLLLSFISLNVEIDDTYIKIKFGYGIFRKSFLLSEITSVKIVRNHWYHGWGIRYWFWPRMKIYNVSGFDAVEIKLENGKIFRIGTDEPYVLEKVLIKIL